MFNIGQYISKLNNKRLSHLAKINDISQIIQKMSGFSVEVSKLKIRNSVLYISNLSSAEKNEIFIKRNILIQEINKTVGENIADIR